MFSLKKDDVKVASPVDDAEEAQVQAADPTAHRKSRAERLYILKLDIFFLAFCCISQIIKYLDQQNITFAYTAGMKEDLSLYGNELNYFTTYFNVGYCIAIIPSQILITWFRPSIYLACLELAWGIFTFCYAACHQVKYVYAIRALVGIAESSAYPGAITLLKIAKRIGFYSASQAMGGLMASALQSAIMGTLDGAHGLAGWRWAFIINGTMTVVVAVATVFFLPDFPDRPSKRASWWLKPADRELALERLERWSRKAPRGANLTAIRKMLFNPILYHLALIYIGFLLSGWGSSYFNLFLKSLKNPDGTAVWTTTKLTAIPMGGYAINIALSFGFCYLSDVLRARWIILLCMAVFVGFPALTILSVWNVAVGAKYYAYFMLYVLQTASPLIWAWMSDLLPTEAEQRSLIIGTCIAWYYATNAWANPLVFSAKQAPHYAVGWYVCLSLCIVSGITVLSLRVYQVKRVEPQLRQIRLEQQEANQQARAYSEALNNDDDLKKHDIAVVGVAPSISRG